MSLDSTAVRETPPRVHGGADARGPARWDFSTCANAAGPCPAALAAVQSADATRYPDPASTAVREALGALHGVAPWRVLPAASASEFIQRITAVTGRLWPGAVRVPEHAYGDYAAAAHAGGRDLRVGEDDEDDGATLVWHADPSSPFGGRGAAPGTAVDRRPTVLDAVYEPLRLQGVGAWPARTRDAAFVLHSPNKALGLTGVRGAYALAPRAARYDLQACCAALHAAAPSWPLSSHAEALLRAWATPEVQGWVAQSRGTLAAWKAALQQRLAARGFALWPGDAPHFVVRPPRPLDTQRLHALGVGVRDAASFGLAGCWRLSAQPPAAQHALMQALDRLEAQSPSPSDRARP